MHVGCLCAPAAQQEQQQQQGGQLASRPAAFHSQVLQGHRQLQWEGVVLCAGPANHNEVVLARLHRHFNRAGQVVGITAGGAGIIAGAAHRPGRRALEGLVSGRPGACVEVVGLGGLPSLTRQAETPGTPPGQQCCTPNSPPLCHSPLAAVRPARGTSGGQDGNGGVALSQPAGGGLQHTRRR